MNKELSFMLKNVPKKPGVYIFKNAKDEMIYVGKAKSLFKRVNSYFQKEHENPKTSQLVCRIASVDFMVTDNELEALILELNLIKKHLPVFNIDYKDDKSYPYIAITLEDKYPRITVTREAHKKSTKYIGPYVNAAALRQTVDTLRTIFRLRSCPGPKPGRKSHRAIQKGKAIYTPCLNYHIEKCLAPCSHDIKVEDYNQTVDQVIVFLEGKGRKTIASLEKEMKKAVSEEQFEKAARLRDRIVAAEMILNKQKVASKSGNNLDIFGTASADGYFAVALFMVRTGKLIGSENFHFKEKAESEPLSSFIKRYYDATSFVSKEILLAKDMSDKEAIELWLGKIKGSRVVIRKAQRGPKKRLLDLAARNARHNLDFQLKRLQVESERLMTSLKELKEALGIKMPYRIECFDISNIAGTNAVGSMVVFENGKSKKDHYRKFKVHFNEGINDYQMLAEIVGRRLKGLSKGGGDKSFKTKPDLIIIDGGKGQLSAAQKVLNHYFGDGSVRNGDSPSVKDCPHDRIDIAALAKKEEELFTPTSSEPIKLPDNSAALRLVQAIRDEAHRFAIQYHRLLRTKAMLKA